MRCVLVGESGFLEEASFLLSQTGYEVSGCSFHEAIPKIAINHPDIAIIHLKPDVSISAFVLQLQRLLGPDQGSYCPILVGIVPHETSKEEHIKYYNIGFELVVDSPVDTDILMARIKAISRRVGIGKTITQSQHLMLDSNTRDCFLKTSNGELLGYFKATPMQFDIILLLVQRPRWVWSRDQLEQILSDKMSRFDKRAVDTAINRLRERFKAQVQKLPANSWQIDRMYRYPFVQTDYGAGYYFLDCLQLGKELRAHSLTLPPVQQGEFMLWSNSTRQFPFNVDDCTLS